MSVAAAKIGSPNRLDVVIVSDPEEETERVGISRSSYDTAVSAVSMLEYETSSNQPLTTEMRGSEVAVRAAVGVTN